MSRVAKQVENVLIIGAGLSGLSCAYALQVMGLNTTLLESRDEVGGRMGLASPARAKATMVRNTSLPVLLSSRQRWRAGVRLAWQDYGGRA